MRSFLFSALLFFGLIAAAQNVGINTTTPGYPLTVSKDGIGISQESAAGTGKIGFYTVGTSTYLQTHTPTNLLFTTNNGSPQMILQTTTGNVGIAQIAPAEKLDVTGNINLTGTIKTNGDGGAANQVLMKNAANALVWGTADGGGYKNITSYLDNGTWAVPAGITNITVEVWGGGGGGCASGGGGAGAYAYRTFAVAAGEVMNIFIGDKGTSPLTETGDGTAGGTTQVYGTINPFITQAGGGYGASNGFAGPTSLPQNYKGALFCGEPGKPTTFSFQQASATLFYEVRAYGDGGGSAPYYNNGGKGGIRVINTAGGAEIKRVAPTNGSFPGGGGAGGFDGSSWGTYGAKGFVVIHY
jgi:hypothetical protein